MVGHLRHLQYRENSLSLVNDAHYGQGKCYNNYIGDTAEKKLHEANANWPDIGKDIEPVA